MTTLPHLLTPFLRSLAGFTCLVALSLPAYADPAAIPPSSSGTLKAKASAAFERFSEGWLSDLRARGKQARRAGQNHSGPGEDYQVELRPTGKARAPYVGILRYSEHRVRCQGAGNCQRVATQRVSEIFRFQNGKWVY